jgi:hypothetical protein
MFSIYERTMVLQCRLCQVFRTYLHVCAYMGLNFDSNSHNMRVRYINKIGWYSQRHCLHIPPTVGGLHTIPAPKVSVSEPEFYSTAIPKQSEKCYNSRVSLERNYRTVSNTSSPCKHPGSWARTSPSLQG